MSPQHSGESIHSERERILLHIAASRPADAAALSRRMGLPASVVQEEITALIDVGSVFIHGGSLHARGASAIVAASDPRQLQEVFDQTISELSTAPTVQAAPLIALAQAGCTDDELLRLLVSAVIDSPRDATNLGALKAIARARSLSSAHLDLLLADAALLQGDTQQVITFAEPLIEHADVHVASRAARVAARAHLYENRFAHAEALFRHVGAEHIGTDAAWAVVVAVGLGDLAQAHKWRAALAAATLTSEAAGLIDFADGLLASVEQNGEGSLDLLARSVNMLSGLGDSLALPESPASVAALIALGTGEPEVARMILDRALAAQLGGAMGRPRHQLLRAWALMAQGHMSAAETAIQQLEPAQQLSDRDVLLFRCLQAGIARRRSDNAGMREAWKYVRAHSFGMSLTIFDLLALGEMMVVAARLRDRERVADSVRVARELLDRLGGSIVWAAPLHWHGVLAAFQADDPSSILPHAQALASAGSVSAYAATLARSGQTWLEVLRRQTDMASVEQTVRALARAGHAWDASRLAGQAALQHPEREDALALMQLAREIMVDYQRESTPAPKSSLLTSREVEVGRLVLDGQGYRAIGEQLFISPKTVEHHVARMRTRLGATSRGELLEKLHDEIAAVDE